MLILGESAYRNVVRPALFRLGAERSHGVASKALRTGMPWRLVSPVLTKRDRRLNADLCGLPLANPIGLAAGFDKDCEMIPALSSLGFGYVTVGTVTAQPREGNPRPRLLRDIQERSLVNAMGFPGKGLARAARRLERLDRRKARTPLVVSVAGESIADVVHCHRRLEPFVDAVEVNISSPNTSGLRVFHQPEALAGLVGALNDARHEPLMVKLPPYPSLDAPEDQRQRAREALLTLARVCAERGVDGLTLGNTRPIEDGRLASGSGGLSGRPIFREMVEMVGDARAEVGGAMTINACGGVFTGEDAFAALRAGATTVQVYTGFVYRGPTAAREINRELLRALDSAGAPGAERSVASARASVAANAGAGSGVERAAWTA